MAPSSLCQVMMLVLGVLVLVVAGDPIASDFLPKAAPDVAPDQLKQLIEAMAKLQRSNEQIVEDYNVIKRENEAMRREFSQKTVGSATGTDADTSRLAAGAVYTRWGRTVCEGDAVPLYVGYAAGALYSSTSGGSDMLCLLDFPEWGGITTGVQTASSIYGVEYRLDATTGSPFSTVNNGGATLLNHDAPCVVCHAETRQTHVMIPAKMSCPPDWTIEYWGYLVSSAHGTTSHYRSAYTCLDEAPEVVPNSVTNQNDALWYPVQSRCGSLPCPSYIEGREVTCVVCSK